MAHPYTTTIAGLVAVVRQLRSSFPATVTAETLKKWSIASNNEAPVLVVIRFLGLVDEEGKKDVEKAKAFLAHDDADFAQAFEPIVRSAYSDLFDTWGDGAWGLEKNKLIGFFRSADGTSARVGQEQASTFLALAGLAGHGAVPATGAGSAPRSPARAKKVSAEKPSAKEKKPANSGGDVGKLPAGSSLVPSVTLRVEINLPVTDDQSVYDSIFKSIKAHLLNA